MLPGVDKVYLIFSTHSGSCCRNLSVATDSHWPEMWLTTVDRFATQRKLVLLIETCIDIFL